MYKNRAISPKVRQLVDHFPVVVITGARQVGKTTLINHLFPGFDKVVFDPVQDIENARAEPDLFLDNHPAPLVLDEIQYAAEVVPSLKRRVDLGCKSGSYILTGSQQWEILKTISESLAGRAAFVDLEGFSLAEISEDTADPDWLSCWLNDAEGFIKQPPVRREITRTLVEQLWRGWLPAADTIPLDLMPAFHEGYMRTYIERDVRQHAEVEDWQRFGRFVQLSAAMNGREINYSQLGRDISITPQTAQRWLSILKATFQWFEVPAFSGNAIKRLSEKPKGYLADCGFACYLQRISSPAALAGHPQLGALFESAVAAEIRKMSSLLGTSPMLYHWRSHGGAEVDLILERDGILFPVEVKLTANPSRKDARGIQAFRATYRELNIAPGLVITPGSSTNSKALTKISDHDYALDWSATLNPTNH
jgi:predicted AAA+ superfamily ATPase